MSLRSRLILRLSLGMLIFAAALFIPAGTWRYWQGWGFLVVASAFSLGAFSYFYKHDRQALERRLRSKEKISEQKRVVRLVKLVFAAALLIPGFDHRLGWSRTLLGEEPWWLSLISNVLVVCGMGLVFWVVKVNSFAGRTIEVEAGQKLISSGPYAVVRHPMYAGMLLFLLSLPLALGSYVAWPAFVLLVPLFASRLLNEERFLHKELPEYREYCLHTRFRLVPYVW
jgi:protein-S-isoprenylcysteine O-methyltransferase Ste14